MSDNAFLSSTGEKLLLNQYWYSTHSINQMVDEIELYSKRCAFLSTPSIFFSLKNSELKENSALLDVSHKPSNTRNLSLMSSINQHLARPSNYPNIRTHEIIITTWYYPSSFNQLVEISLSRCNLITSQPNTLN